MIFLDIFCFESQKRLFSACFFYFVCVWGVGVCVCVCVFRFVLNFRDFSVFPVSRRICHSNNRFFNELGKTLIIQDICKLDV